MTDIFGLDTLLAQLMLALGLAMVAGNGLAMLKHRQGKSPSGITGSGSRYRPGRAWFLLTVGTLISVWAAVGLLT